MPLDDKDLDEVRRRVLAMYIDTVQTFRQIELLAPQLYGERAPIVQAAIAEYLRDFVDNPTPAGQRHAEVMVFETPKANFQRGGLYGAQLSWKEQQVVGANRTLREQLMGKVRRLLRRPFAKWVDVINNFLGSLAAATGLGEALKELKDCLRDELPEGDNP